MDTRPQIQNFNDLPVSGGFNPPDPGNFWSIDEQAVLTPPLGHEYEISVEVFFNWTFDKVVTSTT